MTELVNPSDYRDCIGTVESDGVGLLTREQVRRYARAVEDENPLFFDLEYAKDQGYDDIVVPPNYLSAIIDYTEGRPVAGRPGGRLRPHRQVRDRERNHQIRGDVHRYLPEGEPPDGDTYLSRNVA